MYAVEVREHIMIAHSLKGAVFGPAQNLHGATYVVDVCFQRARLTADNIVVDIGLASETLRAVLQPLNYSNLDALPELAGEVTTTEFLCRFVWDAMAAAIRNGMLGEDAKGIETLRVTLHESHVALAWFEDSLG
jgi:6-pyruvoyl-tetrahydropterin synthase